MFAEILRFPDWLCSVSPFEHLACVPVESFDTPGCDGAGGRHAVERRWLVRAHEA